MLETSITKSIQRNAKSRGWWVMKIAGGPFQKAGVPDLLLIKNGLAVFLEVKQPGKKPTPLQVQVMRDIAATGGATTAVVTSWDEADKILKEVDS